MFIANIIFVNNKINNQVRRVTAFSTIIYLCREFFWLLGK